MRFSSGGDVNVITRKINIYFDYIVAKTVCKNGHHKAILRLHVCILISEKIIETVVFVLRKAVRLLFKAVF